MQSTVRPVTFVIRVSLVTLPFLIACSTGVALKLHIPSLQSSAMETAGCWVVSSEHGDKKVPDYRSIEPIPITLKN